MNYEPFTSIENPTLAHFRHFRHYRHFIPKGFSSLFTLSLLYICRESSTNQLLFMQNKPNFRKSQMNVTPYNTTEYKNIANWTLGENKPNSNPIKPNFRKAKMNVNLTLTKGYRKNDPFAVQKNKPNSNPISVKPKMNINLYVIKEYENETAFRLPKKQTQSKPISVPLAPFIVYNSRAVQERPIHKFVAYRP